jgi:hypothetical protein
MVSERTVEGLNRIGVFVSREDESIMAVLWGSVTETLCFLKWTPESHQAFNDWQCGAVKAKPPCFGVSKYLIP